MDSFKKETVDSMHVQCHITKMININQIESTFLFLFVCLNQESPLSSIDDNAYISVKHKWQRSFFSLDIFF